MVKRPLVVGTSAVGIAAIAIAIIALNKEPNNFDTMQNLELQNTIAETINVPTELQAARDAVSNLDTSNTVSAIMAITDELGIETAAAIELARNLPGYSSGGAMSSDQARFQTMDE